jgi:OPA family glycerol-3-phosphate transporter-like MFS transporter
MVAVLAVFAVAVNLINDGLKTWVPSIMKETYGLDNSLSIVLSLALPMVALFSNIFSVWMHDKIPNFVTQCGIAFSGAALVMGVVIAGLSLGQFVITLLGFAAVCFLIASCNNLITGVFPLFMKDKINSGRIAGVMNGFCYLGSTISSYGLGLIADNGGWNAVFYLLLGVCLTVVLVAAVYVACVGMRARKNKN